jgi:hypothetical protein
MLAAELHAMGHTVSYQLVAELLASAGYSLQGNRKSCEGPNHPDRDDQFRYINGEVRHFQVDGQPCFGEIQPVHDLCFVNSFKDHGSTGQRFDMSAHSFDA